MLKILHVITDLASGGAQQALRNFLAHACESDCSSSVIALRGGGSFEKPIEEMGIDVRTIGMHRGALRARDVKKLLKYSRSLDFDVVQGWMYHGNLAATICKWLHRTDAALIWNIRHSLYDINAEKRLTKWVIKVNRSLSRYPDAIVYNSHISRTQHEHFGFASSIGTVIPNGFDTSYLFPSAEYRENIRRELGIPLGTKAIGHVSRFHAMKDHGTFFRAAALVAAQMRDVQFILCGRGVLPDNTDIKANIPHNIKEKFHLLGEVSDMRRVYAGLDVLCLSSAWGEGFPNTLGEAMSMGVVCVATDVGDSAQILNDVGYIVPKRDANGLANTLVRVLSLPTEEKQKLGKSARRRIKDNYAIRNSIASYLQLYQSLVQQMKSETIQKTMSR